MNSLPSPESSPSPSLLEVPVAQPSRKRQRSLSMHSDTSTTSVKRSVSEAPAQDSTAQNTQADQMSTLSLADQNQEADAYMAIQDGADELASFPPLEPFSDVEPLENVDPADKLKFVEERKQRSMQVGETWYLVSHQWWKRWKKACTGEEDKEGPVSEADLGPVDNSSLLDSYGKLKLALCEDLDLQFVPSDVWRCFIGWYGAPLHPLPRKVIARGLNKEPSLELHPPRFKVLNLAGPRKAYDRGEPQCAWVTLSAGETMEKLCAKLAQVAKPTSQPSSPYRVWKVDPDNFGWNYNEFPSEYLMEAKGKVIEESHRTLEEEGLQSEDGFVVEFKQPEGWIVSSQGALPQFPTLSQPIFNSNEGFFNKMNASSATNRLRNNDSLSSVKFSPMKPSSATSIINNSRNVRTLDPGTLGLTNMGNTCFMNSALQCLAHTKELTDYFLSGVYEEELNADNPLGMGGAIAEAFSVVLQRIWATTGSSTSYAPREFKQALQRFAPQFSGYQQHDSQELVAFLLDGLHEDLNRILKKPYVEKPDWEGGGDLELVELAKTSWDGYLLRNDSVIVDLFQGQYKSTLVCPECEKVSITFDPFMYLTLPIPIQKKWRHTIFYIPWDTEKPHCKVPIETNREASFKDVKNLLGRWMDVPPEHLLTLEIFNNRFYKNLDDSVLVCDMSEHDTIVCFELPCDSGQQRGYKRKPEDPYVLPMFLCDAKMGVSNNFTTSYTPRTPFFGYPTVVVIDPEQATDLDKIYQCAIERLVRWTNHGRDLYSWEPGAESIIEGIPAKFNGTETFETVTEIKENGEVVTVTETPQEGDICDEKTMIVDVDLEIPKGARVVEEEPRCVGHKKDLFTLQLQTNYKDFGANTLTSKWESWERRVEMALSRNDNLLRENDALFCEFDDHMKLYYFGDNANHYEHARWDHWESFVHPEYEEAMRKAEERKDKGISLQDCLNEFTKEEKLGEDDLWYCPRCKKHQQATKRFDLWKAPDILVVHLKRFSNSRTLRDKIDVFIDFPISGLDLENMVEERAVAKKLQVQGISIEELNLTNLDEPLVYDLYGVDEHIGGLGGGHYRAYTFNHMTDKWYHFDDSWVKPAQARDAVNSDAYLLFYRRRTNKPLGGKSQKKIWEAKENYKVSKKRTPSPTVDHSVMIENQLPTPPDDNALSYVGPPPGDLSTSLDQEVDQWTMRSGTSITSLTPSDDPPDFEEAQSEPLYLDLDRVPTSQLDYLTPSNRPSPTSSIDAYMDITQPSALGVRHPSLLEFTQRTMRERTLRYSPDWDPGSNLASPSYSDSLSDMQNDRTEQLIREVPDDDYDEDNRSQSPEARA